MYAKAVPIFCLAYIVGLAIAAGIGQYGLTIAGFGLVAGVIFLRIAPNYNWWGLRWQTGLGIVLVFFLALASFYIRLPSASMNDVSNMIRSGENGRWVTVTGKVLNSPTLNRSGKLKFWLSPQKIELNQANPKPRAVTGKLYTTLSPKLKQDLNPGSIIKITGYLYQPSILQNPGQFSFQEYLNQNGAFAGLSGRDVTVLERANWGFWRLRDRMVKVHVQALDSPRGELVSSIVLGRKAVNLTYEVQDQFLKAGLSHILAASGFHVSLLLGTVLVLTQRFQG